MRQKIRCRFELHSSEIAGIPKEYAQVKLVIGHQQNSKRYAASHAIPTTGSDQGVCSTKGLDDPAAGDPLLAFTCHVYPSKAVDVRLMGASSGNGSRSLLARGPQWTHIASTTLHLDSLAHQLLLPGIPTSGAVNHTSAPIPAAAQQPAAAADPASSQQAQLPLPLPRPGSPFANLPVLDDDDDSELFTADSLAAAVTARYGRPSSDDRMAPAGARSPFASASLGTPTASSAKAGLGSMSDLMAAADTAAVPDTAEVPPEVEGAEAEAGSGYQQDSQATQLHVQWVTAELHDVHLQQELTVTAHLLEAGGVQRLLGLVNPTSRASSRRSAASSLVGAKGRPWSKSMTPRAQGQQAGKEFPVHRSVTVPASRGERPAAAAAAAGMLPGHQSRSQPSTPLRSPVGSQQGFMGLDVAALPGRDRLQHGNAAAAAVAPAATPAKPGPATPFNTPAKLPSHIHAAEPNAAAAHQPNPPRSATNSSSLQPQDPQQQEASDQAAKREFLELILSTLSSSHSLESDAQLPPPSAAQLAAAASLPRTPSTADLAAFAAATGLPMNKVTQAAASKLGSGATPRSSASPTPSSSRSASNRSSPKRAAPAAAAANAAGGSSSVAAVRLYDVTEEVEDKALTVPVVAVAEEVTTAAGAEPTPAAAAARTGAADDVGSSAADVLVESSLPATVVVATAVAAHDDVGNAAQQPGDGWEPHQLAVATTVITAAPVAAGVTGAQAAVAAVGETADAGAQEMVVTTVTDVAVTVAADAAGEADLAATAVPLAGSAAPAAAAGDVEQAADAAAEHVAETGTVAAAASGAPAPAADAAATEAIAVEQQDVADEAVVQPAQQHMPYAQALMMPSSPLPAAPEPPPVVPAAMLAMLPPGESAGAAELQPAAPQASVAAPVASMAAAAELAPPPPPAAAREGASPRSGSALDKLQQELQHLKQQVQTNVAAHSAVHSPDLQPAITPAAPVSSVLAAPAGTAAPPASLAMPAGADAAALLHNNSSSAAHETAAEEGAEFSGIAGSSSDAYAYEVAADDEEDAEFGSAPSGTSRRSSTIDQVLPPVVAGPPHEALGIVSRGNSELLFNSPDEEDAVPATAAPATHLEAVIAQDEAQLPAAVPSASILAAETVPAELQSFISSHPAAAGLLPAASSSSTQEAVVAAPVAAPAAAAELGEVQGAAVAADEAEITHGAAAAGPFSVLPADSITSTGSTAGVPAAEEVDTLIGAAPVDMAAAALGPLAGQGSATAEQGQPLLSVGSSRLADVLNRLHTQEAEEQLAAAESSSSDWLPRALPTPTMAGSASVASAAAAAAARVGGVLASSSLGVLHMVESKAVAPAVRRSTAAGLVAAAGLGTTAAAAAAGVGTTAAAAAGGAVLLPAAVGVTGSALLWWARQMAAVTQGAAHAVVATACFLPRTARWAAGSMMSSTQAPAAAPATAEAVAAPAALSAMPELPARSAVKGESSASAAAAPEAGVAVTVSAAPGGLSMLGVVRLMFWQLPWSVAVASLTAWGWLLSQLVAAPAGALINRPTQRSTPAVLTTVAAQPADVGLAGAAGGQPGQFAGSLPSAAAGSGVLGGSSTSAGVESDVESCEAESPRVGSMRWLLRARPSGQVPPTPAPSLESSSSLMGRSWSSMLPATVLASLTSPAAALLNLSRASSSTAPDAADEAPATPRSILGCVFGGAASSKAAAAAAGSGAAGKLQPALPTILSMHELASVVAAAEESEVAAATVPAPTRSRLGMPPAVGLGDTPVEGTPLALSGELDSSSSTSSMWPAMTGSWGWWPAVSRAESVPVVAPAAPAAAAPVHAVPAADDGFAGTVTASSSWWPSWSAVSGPERTTQQWLSATAAAAAEPQAVPAAADAGAGSSSTATSAWQLARTVVGYAAAPVVWYWQAVGHTLSAGVDMASWLVEMAVWWAMLPARMAVWALLLPFRLEAGLVRWLLLGRAANSQQQAEQQL